MSALHKVVISVYGSGKQRRVNLLLCVVLVALLAALFAVIVRNPVEIAIEPVRSAPPLQLTWFDASAPRQLGNVEKLATATFNGQLLGLLEAGARSTATIRLQGQSEQVFRLGETIVSGVRLVAVEQNRIVVEQRGQQRELLLDIDGLTSSELSAINEPSAASGLAQPGAGNAALALAGLFSAQPVQLESGSGLLLSDIGEEMSILTDLQQGDIVVAVEQDGQRLSVDQLTATPQLLAGLAMNSELPITVVRDGNEITLMINAASLAARVMPNLNINQ
ncbi:MAG: type II secretion system protein N [Porticoccaceae bacterium]